MSDCIVYTPQLLYTPKGADLSNGDRVFHTCSNLLPWWLGRLKMDSSNWEYYQDGLRVVNRQCKMESISFAIPTSNSPRDCLHLRRPTHNQVPPQKPRTGKVPLKVPSSPVSVGVNG